ncbi:MAG: magnesium transporter, partial [Vicinamibacterales bacterium]
MDRETLLNDIRQLIRERDADAIARLGDSINRADLARAIPDLTPAEVAVLLQWLPDDEIADLLAELEPEGAARILRTLTLPVAAHLLEEIDPDDATDILEELTSSEAEEILIAMEPAEAEEIRELLAYPPETAGGRMTPAYVAVSPDLRADQAVVALRRVAEEAETVNYVYVTDDEETLLGVLSLHNLVLTPPHTRVRDLMATEVICVPALADQEVAARLLNDYHLLALPVIDDERHLLGIITVDDVADILEAEATEDIERLGGSQPLAESYLRARPLLLWRRRVIWLLVLFLAGAYTSTILRYFDDEIESVVALSFFIPLLIGIGGNVGSQVVTTIVRSMAVDDIRIGDTFRIVRKELQTALMLSAVLATAMFVRAIFMGVGVDLGLVVAISVTAIVVWAAVIAAVLPLLLRQF